MARNGPHFCRWSSNSLVCTSAQGCGPPPGAPFSDHRGQDCALRGRPHLQSPPSAFPLLVAIRCCQAASWSEVFPVGSSVSGCDQFVFHPVFVSHLWLFPGRSPSFAIELRTQTIFAERPGGRPRAIPLVRAGPREPASWVRVTCQEPVQPLAPRPSVLTRRSCPVRQSWGAGALHGPDTLCSMDSGLFQRDLILSNVAQP